MIIETKWSLGDAVWAIMDRQLFDKPIRSHGMVGYERKIKPCLATVSGVNVMLWDDDRRQEWYTLFFEEEEYSSNSYSTAHIFATEEECRRAFAEEHPTLVRGDYTI